MSEAFAPFEARMREAGLPELAIRTFERSYEELRSGATGTLSRRDLLPVGEIASAEALGDVREAGAEALPRSVVVKLNGGLGTSMGMTRAKSLLEVKDGLSFLDVTARQIGVLRERHGCAVPLVLMDSFRTREDSLVALARYAGLSGPLPPDFLQHKVPRIREDDLAPVSWPAEPEHEWCPPGHGDLYTALVTSGMLDAMRSHGYRYAFVSNADNLGAVLDLDLLGWFAASGAPFAMEVKVRGAADRKGGHLARLRDGRLTLREIAQCPPDELDDFQDVTRHGWFNTNNLWVDLDALHATLGARDAVLGLPLIRNVKPVDPEAPDSPRVIQLETAMGAAISVFEGAAAVHVPAHRFAPVKTTGDLLRVRSDACLLTDDFRIVPAPDSAGDALVVDLDPAFYRTVAQLEERAPAGPPSLRGCTALRVRGDVRFGKGVVLHGRVALEAPPGAPLKLPDGARIEGDAEGGAAGGERAV